MISKLKIFKALGTFTCLIFFSNCYSNNLTKEKINLIRSNPNINKNFCIPLDVTSIDDVDNLGCEFFISFNPATSYKKLPTGINIPLFKKTDNLFILGLPYISPYGYPPGTVYCKERLALIMLSPIIHNDVIPQPLKAALSQKLHVNQNNLISELKKLQINFNAIILGNHLRALGTELAQGPPDDIYNVRYHFWAAMFHDLNQIQDKTDPYRFIMSRLPDFNDHVEMGLFSPQGIIAIHDPNSIALDQFRIQDVYWHKALSPNNARFKIDRNRQLSSFWAAAISPDLKHVSITYFLIANTDRMRTILQTILSSSNNLEQLKIYLSSFRMKYSWVSNEDFQTLSTWVNTIVNAVSETPTPSVIQPIIQPKPQIQLPKISLENAKNLLINLSSILNSLSLRH